MINPTEGRIHLTDRAHMTSSEAKQLKHLLPLTPKHALCRMHDNGLCLWLYLHRPYHWGTRHLLSQQCSVWPLNESTVLQWRGLCCFPYHTRLQGLLRSALRSRRVLLCCWNITVPKLTSTTPPNHLLQRN
jgi:hypothetical protein